MARRRLGYGRGPRQKFEQDELTLLGGVRHGRTLGSPVAIEISNSEWLRSDKWHEEMSPAPGVDQGAADPGPARATPISPACRSTASPTPATCSSGPAPARRRHGSRPARSPRSCSPSSASSILSHVIQMGAVRSKAVERPTPADLDRVDESPVRCFDAGGRGGDDRRDQGRGQGRRLARAASSRCSATACRSASAATSTGTARSTPRWPRRS